MLSFDEGEVFFDSADYLSSEESVFVEDNSLLHGYFGYGIWLKDPQSVKERRESFLRGMGFVGLSSSRDMALSIESDNLGLERIVECSAAVSSNCASPIDGAEENLVRNCGELNGKANCAIDELKQQRVKDPSVALEGDQAACGLLPVQTGRKNFDMDKKKVRSWWKHFITKRKRTQSTNVSKVLKPIAETTKMCRMTVHQNKKRRRELTAVFVGQKIHAHEGFIWTMKFSPDGQYLASGGEDGVVRIWLVTQVDASCKNLDAESKFGREDSGGKFSSGRKKSSHFSVVIPDKVFQIEELPLQEFHGHTSDVLDLAWSKSNLLLSSSKDKTVRLWQVGCNECLRTFSHNSYVTCIKFNPTNENYFITGSIDGKIRTWGVSERRVVDWSDMRDAVTAICYQPDGKGFIAGSITGTCCFYGASDDGLQLNAQIRFHGRKKSSNNKITGIQFIQEDSRRVMVTSEDSKVRILDGIDIVHKYRGLAKSGSQMSASLTSTGRHIISVGNDSRVYVWNYDDPHAFSSKQTHSVRSCEHFFSEGVMLAIPWLGTGSKQNCLSCGHCLQTRDHKEASSWKRDSSRFSLSSWFSMDGGCSRGSVTWPEEKLPLWDVPMVDDHHNLHDQHCRSCGCRDLSSSWGLVIVTAGRDGMIRTFHNYGLPSGI